MLECSARCEFKEMELFYLLKPQALNLFETYSQKAYVQCALKT